MFLRLRLTSARQRLVARWHDGRGAFAQSLEAGRIAIGDQRMDLAITIRTCVIAGGKASIQVGAGIVADSVPEREWDETENKARALLTALGRVRK